MSSTTDVRASTHRSAIDRAINNGEGVVRLAPTWVPRAFCTPGRRIRLHPDDYYPFGKGRGGIDERWLASAIRADNGPATGEFEGLSLVVGPGGTMIPMDEFIGDRQSEALGDRMWREYGAWPMYSKFFDNQSPLPLHVHHRDEHAALVDKPGKPEAYYYPPEMNNHLGEQSISFLGLRPDVDRALLREKLSAFARGGDNGITELSVGYRTILGTGWDIPGGILHAPASVCTYEPQAACDVLCMCESWSNHQEVDSDLLWKDVPHDRKGDVDFILELIDWSANTDPMFFGNRSMAPIETKSSKEDPDSRFTERWIVYKSDRFSATEVRVDPGSTVVMCDTDAYGAIIIQGTGRVGVHPVHAATALRFGQLSEDELFVTASAANSGVTVTNLSATEPLVMLKHFGPGNLKWTADFGDLSS